MTIAQISKLTDNDLILSYLNHNDSRNFNILYNRYITKIYGKCLSLLKNDSWAKDASQEVFMKIFNNLAKFNQKSKFSTWVYSITHNYCIDILRKKKKENKVFANDHYEIPDSADYDGDRGVVELKLEQLGAVINELKDSDKTVLIMKYRQDMSIKEICTIFNKSESAVKMQLKRAKTKVRTLYKERYAVA